MVIVKHTVVFVNDIISHSGRTDGLVELELMIPIPRISARNIMLPLRARNSVINNTWRRFQLGIFVLQMENKQGRYEIINIAAASSHFIGSQRVLVVISSGKFWVGIY